MDLTINPFIYSGNAFENAIVTQSKISRIFTPLIAEGGSLGIYGERSMGKSLMLTYITNPPYTLRKKYFSNYVFVYLNCQDEVTHSTKFDFWLQVVRKLEHKLELGLIKNKCQVLVGQAEKGKELDHNDFHEVLDVVSGVNKRIVLALDDFDCLIRTDSETLESTRAFLQGFRSLTTRDSNKANLVIATRYSLQELCKPLSTPYYSAFENGFTIYRLRFFSEEELRLLLNRVEEVGQDPFTSLEKRDIEHLSGCHPRLAQIAAAEIFDQRITSGAPLSKNDLTIVGEKFKREACRIFEEIWYGASEAECLLLMLITLQAYQGKISNVNYDLSDLSAIFSSRERELLELAERGLVNRIQDKPPKWQIFSQPFQWWILKEIESTSPAQLNQRRKVWFDLLNQNQLERLEVVFESLKRNRESIETLGRFILQIPGIDVLKPPGV